MAVTIDPSVEACQELVRRINSATTYRLTVPAAYTELQIDPLEEFDELTRVDVVTENETQLNETLAIEDRTSHAIRVWVRAKVDAVDSECIPKLKLLTRQIFQRLNDYDSADGRVRVWECDLETAQNPDKTMLNDLGLFVSSILLRVEVEAS